MKKKNDFPYYLTTFLSHYLPEQKNCSLNTIESYATTFKLFFIFCEENKHIKTEKITLDTFNENIIIEFLDWIENERKCSIASRNQRMVAIHSFCRYVQKKSPSHLKNIHSILNIPYKKVTKTIVPYLEKEQMKIILEQPDSSTKTGFRDLVLLSVLYDTAARVQELIDIKIKDVRLEKSAIITLHGKGDKYRQVPIMNKTVELLKIYIKDYRQSKNIATGDQYLFVNQRKQPLSRWGISHIINKYVASAKKNPNFNVSYCITPHVFRHSKSMHMLQSGVNLIYIRDFLGHVDVNTTEIYARADTEMKRKAIEVAYEDIMPSKEYDEWNKDDDLMKFLNELCSK